MTDIFIRFKNDASMPIDTSYGRGPQSLPLLNISHLLIAFQSLPNSPLANVYTADISLHLPSGLTRTASGLLEECFISIDETDDTLDYGCPLSNLENIVTTSRRPFIVKRLEAEYFTFPAFNPETFDLSMKHAFPFFEDNPTDEHIPLLGRKEILSTVNEIFTSRLTLQKYRPIILSTSRGMGKTFFLKKFGMQQVNFDESLPAVKEALVCGRVLSFDFGMMPGAIISVDDVYSFFTRLMIYFLCKMFHDSVVDGIYFEDIAFKSINMNLHGCRQETFSRWFKFVVSKDAESMMLEYVRLTNLAFNIRSHALPVFCLDEIQSLASLTTDIMSKPVESDNHTSAAKKSKIYHSQLSLLLTQLAVSKPICICAGTNVMELVNITQKTSIMPQVLTLTTLVDESLYTDFWTNLTEVNNRGQSDKSKVSIEGDEDLIDALVYASYQIPRLLYIAHTVWYDLRKLKAMDSQTYAIQKFEEHAKIYYSEMTEVLRNYTPQDLALIILCCGVYWPVTDTASVVPGTKIVWSSLIEQSLVFPYIDNCYIFPFALIWKIATSPGRTNVKKEIEDFCSAKIENLVLSDLFTSHDILCSQNLYNFGTGFEKLFVAALAVKYYLVTLENSIKGYVLFTDLYQMDGMLPAAIQGFRVNFSAGIKTSDTQITVNTEIINAVGHNVKCHNGHHDIILPGILSSGIKSNIPFQCKASFDLSSKSVIESQLHDMPHSNTNVVQMFWLYLGKGVSREALFPQIAFLNGSGCCNGMSLDCLILVKKLQARNNE
ncbi:hypothetical protein BDR26DRAFT_887438 [Obelidium mucronatum]|nr:hypothetical protein BDR26DRAFT_887438 [Obelidium mucronatum]